MARALVWNSNQREFGEGFLAAAALDLVSVCKPRALSLRLATWGTVAESIRYSASTTGYRYPTLSTVF